MKARKASLGIWAVGFMLTCLGAALSPPPMWLGIGMMLLACGTLVAIAARRG